MTRRQCFPKAPFSTDFRPGDKVTWFQYVNTYGSRSPLRKYRAVVLGFTKCKVRIFVDDLNKEVCVEAENIELLREG